MIGTDTLLFSGGAVKALGDGKVGGYLITFGDARATDLTGDYFTPATEFCLDGGCGKSAVYYQHGLDAVLGPRTLGHGLMKTDRLGIWIEAQLALRDEYEKAIYEMAQASRLGWSSGTAGHLVSREPDGKAMCITRWPLGLDASLVTCPAEPRNHAVTLKSLYPAPVPSARPDATNPRIVEAILRDAGVSIREARAIVSGGCRASQPDAASYRADVLKGMEARLSAPGSTPCDVVDPVTSPLGPTYLAALERRLLTGVPQNERTRYQGDRD